jgi:plastocyanin
MNRRRPFPTIPVIVAVAVALGACGGGEKSTDSAQTAAPPPAASAAAGTDMAENLTPDQGGKIIVVQMMTDDQGNNRFDPAEVEAHRGDVVRFTLKTGVHNVHFLPDSNTVKTGLPAASSLLQLPGQTIDLKVSLPEGKYYFQCDPHAALGMTGRLEVENKES